MAAYIARNAEGEQVNIIEIQPAQIASWQELTGLVLEPVPAPEPAQEPDPAEEWPEWVQPAGAADAYAKGDRVSHGGRKWTSDADANTWEPGVYGWTEITEGGETE